MKKKQAVSEEPSEVRQATFIIIESDVNGLVAQHTGQFSLTGEPVLLACSPNNFEITLHYV